ncbi:hypothetical protein [Candidatus Magnetominusculus dajiuhuensis]|uniref:pPIWI-associating nuclease domain-containing protein n=1 Tax=Candidatus Magnetominusculus dajiuhuensis TaxID=3137712 RepID=UPI003B4355A9
MVIKHKYTKKYLHDIAIAQLYDEYEAKGYSVTKEHMIGGYRADLVAQKNGETLVFEVTTGSLTQKGKERLRSLSAYVNSQAGHKFKFIYSPPPRERTIDIENIEEILTTEMIYNMPDELNALSPHPAIEEIYDVDVNEIDIGKDGTISLKGTGTVSVELRYGSDSDNKKDMGHITFYSFPFTFSSKLEHKNRKLDTKNLKIKIDTSKYYE